MSTNLKSVHFKKPVTGFSFLSKSVVIFVVVKLKMTTLFERNEDRVQSLTIAIVFELIYYTNGHPRA